MLGLGMAITMIVSIVVGHVTLNAGEKDLVITLDGVVVESDVEAYINEDGRTMVPVRFVSEALGASVTWDATSARVTIEKDSSTLVLTIGEKAYSLDGATMAMDTEAVIVNDRTMVPVRFVSEALGKSVKWDGSSYTVLITDEAEDTVSYTVVTSGQAESFNVEGDVIDPAQGQAYYGQDADYDTTDFSFTDNGNGTVTDNNTGLEWQQVPLSETMSWADAEAYCESLELGGYDDWRMPTAKELFNLSDFQVGWPFLDGDYFEFPEATASTGPQGGGPQGGAPQGDADTGEDLMAPPMAMTDGDESTEDLMPPASGEGEDLGEGDVSKQEGQFWSSNYYLVGTTHDGAASAFGVNHATGHIKAYPAETPAAMGKYVRAVRGEITAINDYVDNGDGTVTDNATGLMWMQDDGGYGMEWDDALDYAENFEYAGYDDWRLPDVKELQAIVDYSGVYPAIDQSVFNTTVLEENEFYYFWTNTSAYFSPSQPGYGYAWYVAFGLAVDDEGEDTHGAGAVRFSPKTLDSSYVGEGGDNILNSVRLVRDGDN